MEVATKNSESRLGARSGVANESHECGRERESRMGVAKWGREYESRNGVANMSRESGSQK